MTRALPIAALPLALVQLAVGQELHVAGAYLNLVLVVVVAAAVLGGARSGLVAALAGGLLLDLGSPGPLGLHALSLCAAAYAVSSVIEGLDRVPAVAAAAGGLATLVYAPTLGLAAHLFGAPLPDAATAVGVVVSAALVNAVLAGAGIPLLRRLQAA